MKTTILSATLGCGIAIQTVAIAQQPAGPAPLEPTLQPMEETILVQVAPPPIELEPEPIADPDELAQHEQQVQQQQTEVRSTSTTTPSQPVSQGRRDIRQTAQVRSANATGTQTTVVNKPETPGATTPAQADSGANGEKGLRLNFRGAPLELVLDYLSEAAGFIIKPEVDVKGKVDVWSAQPLTKDEAVELLNSVLSKNGYAVLREGRTLTILTKEEARRRSIPVKRGYDPESIPKNDEIVTQIIPVRFIKASQLAKDLQPLLPPQATMTANEGGNAIVITDTQANIRRVAEIIKALDTSVASVSAVRVFALRYADAKSLATVIKEVFQTPTTSSTDLSARFFARFRGGPFGGGADSGGESETGGRPGASRVAAVADERSNSLVVTAPEDLMPTIEELVKAVDVNVEDITELRVFKLKNADPQEMADLLSSLFPDETTAQANQAGRFGRFFAFGPPGTQNTGTETSERMRKQGRVIAVPDPRTGAVVVTASRDLMVQIERMIAELDADPAKKQKVFVFDVQNTDPAQVQSILQGLFPSQTGAGTGTRTTTRQTGMGTQLGTRNTQQQGRTTGAGIGGTGFGTGGATRTTTGR